jgi:glycosyltransferase A (GT-A) superfamily protein (DUF2064 family)
VIEPPAVLVMVRAPRHGEVRMALEPMLGPERCSLLQAALIRRATEWAHAIAPQAVFVAHEPPDSGPELRVLIGDRVVLLPQSGSGIAARVADAAARVFGRHTGPLLIAWPDLPRLRGDHAAAALGDLNAGCDVSLGPVIDGGFYLVALSRPLPQLFGLPEQAWRSPDAMTIGLAAAREAGLEVGILRSERALHRPADMRAALADPLLAPEIERILGGPVRGGSGPPG